MQAGTLTTSLLDRFNRSKVEKQSCVATKSDFDRHVQFPRAKAPDAENPIEEQPSLKMSELAGGGDENNSVIERGKLKRGLGGT
jgi:hypothetical protein